MAVTSMLKNAAESAGGHIEKAIIEIIDLRGRELVVEPPVSMGGSKVPGLSALSTFGGMEALTDAAASVLESAPSGLLPSLTGATRKCFYVQFNPSELSLTGYGGGRVAKTDFSDKDGKGDIRFESAAVRITLNVKLIFDKVDPQDAFMAEKLGTSMTGMAQGAVRSVKGLHRRPPLQIYQTHHLPLGDDELCGSPEPGFGSVYHVQRQRTARPGGGLPVPGVCGCGDFSQQYGHLAEAL